MHWVRAKATNPTLRSQSREGAKITRPPSPMSNTSPDRNDVEVIAFVEDRDGYRIGLIEHAVR